MALLLLITASIVLLPLAYYCWLRYRNTYFKRRGLPAPPPRSLFLGNIPEIQAELKPCEKFYEWEKIYGKTYGTYEGGHHTIVTSDLDILHDIFVKKFEYFHARKLPLYLAIDQDTDHSTADVFGAQGLRWKRLRALSGPALTTNKMKQVESTVIESIVAFVEMLKKRVDQPFNIHPLFGELTLDVIQRVALGRQSTILNTNEKDPIHGLIRTFFSPPRLQENKMATFFAGTYDFLPVTKHLFAFLTRRSGHLFPEIKKRIEKTVIQRRQELLADDSHRSKSSTAPVDFIQMFLETEADEEQLKRLAQESHRAVDRRQLKFERKMNMTEIVGQCTLFLAAGYDTTGNTFAYFAYHLATLPHVQERLIADIDAMFHSPSFEIYRKTIEFSNGVNGFIENYGNPVLQDEITYEAVSNMEYMEWCIKETLRLNPLGFVGCSRKCLQTCTVGNGQLEIEKGVDIRANVLGVHLNKDTWGEDADEFKPERFDPKQNVHRHPMAFLGFGAGPRTCIGMRFAYMEIKLTMCHILKQFRLEATSDTKLVRRGITIMAPESVIVILRKRNG